MVWCLLPVGPAELVPHPVSNPAPTIPAAKAVVANIFRNILHIIMEDTCSWQWLVLSEAVVNNRIANKRTEVPEHSHE
jgi:hypothetical protein